MVAALEWQGRETRMQEEVTELKHGYTWELAAGSLSGPLSRLRGQKSGDSEWGGMEAEHKGKEEMWDEVSESNDFSVGGLLQGSQKSILQIQTKVGWVQTSSSVWAKSFTTNTWEELPGFHSSTLYKWVVLQ